MGILSTITKGLDIVSGIVTNPITAITKGISASTKEFISSGPIENTLKTLGTTAVAGGLLLGGGAVLGSATAKNIITGTVIPTAVKAVTNPKTTLKIAGAGVTALAGASLLTQSPKIREVVSETPASLDTFIGNTATAIENPSVKSFTNIVKESPVISTALGVGAVAGVGLATAGIVSTVTNTLAMKEQTKIMQEGIAEMKTSSVVPTTLPPTLPSAVNVPSSLTTETLPIAGTTETVPIVSTTELPTATEVIPPSDGGVPILEEDVKKKSYRRRKKAVAPIRITNRVDVRNRNINKLYNA